MTTPRDEIEERRIEQLLARLGRRTSAPQEHDLRAMARAAVAPRPPTNGSGRRTRWAHPLRWVGASAAVALLVGSGVGFGLGTSFTSPESARASFVGTGFLPARGWSVVQSGTVDANGASQAIAANVPLRPEDAARDVPYATLESLPADGVVIVASFTTRGDPGADYAYPVATLPLQISNATRAPSGVVVPRPLGEYRLQAGIKGTNVDALIFYGTAQPTHEMRGAAQRQLNRLAVASERVTLFARPTLVERGPVTVFGSVDTNRANEEITIQAKDCGSDFFRVYSSAHTNAGGGWSTPFYPRINTTLRAVWNEAASNQVAIRLRAAVYLDRLRNRAGFRVGAGGLRSFWRKKVLIQRRQGNRWSTVRTVVLTDSLSSSGSGSWAGGTFSVPVPKGTLIRAVLPPDQAKPCYLAGFSRTLRT